MSLATWFRNPPKDSAAPSVSALVRAVASYLELHPDEEYVVPKFVAVSVKQSEVSVMTALRYLQKRGIAKQWFGIFCAKTDVPIEKFATLQEIPEHLPCQVCDETHRVEDNSCKIEVFFTVDRKKLAEFHRSVAA